MARPAVLMLLAVALALLACAPPPGPAPATPTPRPEAPQEVVRAFLEAQRAGRPDAAAAQWGFATDAFREHGDAAAEAALRADFVRKGEDGLPHAYVIGEAEASPRDNNRVYVQVWLDRPRQGPAALYELVRTPDGWKIIGFTPAPSPPLRQP